VTIEEASSDLRQAWSECAATIRRFIDAKPDAPVDDKGRVEMAIASGDEARIRAFAKGLRDVTESMKKAMAMPLGRP
jgi:metal-responsive CopG/Arc/MetJ family transcriptional regulator